MSLKSRLPEIAAGLHPVVEEALIAAAETVAHAAQARVAVDSGRLRDAIHVEPGPEGVHVIAGDNQAWYGHLVEHGTVKMPARPFLVPALEESRPVIEGEMVVAIRRIVG